MSSGGGTEVVSTLDPQRQRIFNLLAQLSEGRLQGGPPGLGLNLPGASPLQSQAFQQAGGAALSPEAQQALQTALGGQAAFQITPEQIAQRSAQFNQAVAPQRLEFADQLRGLQGQLGAAGLSRSGSFGDLSARSIAGFQTGLAGQRAGIAQQDITASIASQQAARAAQLQGVGVENAIRLGNIGQLSQQGQIQRGIGVQQAGADVTNRLSQDPFRDPALQSIFALLGLPASALVQEQGK